MNMKLFLAVGAAALFVLTAGQLRAEEKTVSEKSSEAWEKTKETTKEVGNAVAKKTQEIVAAVEDKIDKPDADARKVDVKINDTKIQMPKSLQAGKTAFVVTNTGKQKHNFQIEGNNLEKKFWLALAPNATKTMQVELKAGSYEVDCPLKEHASNAVKTQVTVK